MNPRTNALEFVPLSDWQAQLTLEMRAELAAMSQMTFAINPLETFPVLAAPQGLCAILTEETECDTTLLAESLVDMTASFFMILSSVALAERSDNSTFDQLAFCLCGDGVEALLFVQQVRGTERPLFVSQVVTLQKTTHSGTPTRLTVTSRSKANMLLSTVQSDTATLRTIFRMRSANLLTDVLYQFGRARPFDEPFGTSKNFADFQTRHGLLRALYARARDTEERLVPLLNAVLQGTEMLEAYAANVFAVAANLASGLCSGELESTQTAITGALRQLTNLISLDTDNEPTQVPVGITRNDTHRLIALLAISYYAAEPRPIILASHFGVDPTNYQQLCYANAPQKPTAILGGPVVHHV